MSDLLSIGASGLRAYQSALTTVSDNIANSATPGYSRRAVQLAENASTNGVLAQERSTVGNGVAIVGVQRLSDELRNSSVRASGADLARTESSITWMARIEGALTGNQLGSRIADFFNSAKAVAADPTSSPARTGMLEAATSAATAFQTTARALEQVNTDLDQTADGAVDRINQLGAMLAKINEGLGRTPPNTTSQAQLFDQRDAALTELSALTDITVTFTNGGRVDVAIGGPTGPKLVDRVTSGTLSYVRNASGAVSFAMLLSGQSAIASPGGGALAGIAEGAQRIADARNQLDAIATGFVTGVNDVQAQGRDLDGNPGAPMFAAGATPASFTLALTNPRGIAAAAVGGGPRDNGNFANLQAMRAAGGFEAAATSLIADNAATLAGRRLVAEAQTAIHDGAITARDQVSGVNLDTEAVELLRFQQAYQASSKVIQIARDTLQTLLNVN
ncbi:flagellar hook-associated protein FlgK [Sphingomonas sp.]|uniref:flagellar hook-associated protein FlgK n=1 Tax=Sphingomonas sp. TaxID=28214 RepID=UPI001D399E6F|nr:flagellar hook-associated protein FlgK [Sphingomonas sp.]MBX9795380.1 flagellar hook-associated protein FlgK [Sphingomonas sp.]